MTMIRNVLTLMLAAVVLSACETPTTQRYAISADNNAALRALRTDGVGIGSFSSPAEFNEICRGLGPLKVADNMSHTKYIEKAFQDELQIAGMFAPVSPRVTLTGRIERLEFSSTRSVTGGSWTVDLALQSSNGQRLKVNEYYEFESGFLATEACRQTADAFSRAVQNLVGKAIRNPAFASLVR